VAFSTPLGASTILFQTDSQLIALSERVVHARVVAQRVTRVGPSGHRIFTVTTLAILEDFTGREGDTVDVWELGGTLDGQTLFVGGQVRYAIGEEVLVCLDRGSIGLRSVAMGFSKFSVVRTGNASAQLRRGVDANTSIVGGVVPAQERSLDEFRALAATVLRTPSRVVARPIPDGPATVSQPWTKIVGEPGWRWRDADQKVPVLVYRNVSAPSPLLSGDGVTEIETALAAWTNPTTASIILQYAGTALESSVEGGWSTIPAHSTLITFEDPGEIIGSPVLALGGGMASVGTGGTVGGVVYDGIDFGFMVFQNAADLPASFRQPLNFSRIVTHELGHTMGLKHGHSDYTAQNLQDDLHLAATRFGTRALEATVDGQPYSLMTYRGGIGQPGTPFEGDQFNQPQTYMLYDIAALQYLYGANYNVNAGDSVYTFSTATGEMFINGVGQGVPTADIVFRTVWDGNGMLVHDNKYEATLAGGLTAFTAADGTSGLWTLKFTFRNAMWAGDIVLTADTTPDPDAITIGGTGSQDSVLKYEPGWTANDVNITVAGMTSGIITITMWDGNGTKVYEDIFFGIAGMNDTVSGGAAGTWLVRIEFESCLNVGAITISQ
jgi:hypothetical protein